MSTRNAKPMLVGLAWVIALAIPWTATDARAQAAAAQKEAPTRPTVDAKRGTADAAKGGEPGQAQPTGETRASTSTASTETKAAEGAAAPAASTSTVADVPTAATAESSNGGEVSTGSGLFEQAQSAASSESSSSSSGGSESPRGFELGGYVRGATYVGRVPDSNQGELKAGYGELALQFRTPKETYGDGYAELRMRNGLQGGTTSQTIFDVREAYVNGYFGPLDLRFGKQIVVWGRADAFNPTNNITPNDLRVRSHIEDDRRVGNIGARAFLNFLPFRLEGIWMPLYVASELPAYQLPQYVEFGKTRYPSPRLDNGLGAGRVHLELPAIEMSASFVHGYAPLPSLTLQSWNWGINPPVIQISRTAYVHDVVGFDFSTTIGDYLGVRGEVAYRRPRDYTEKAYVPRPDLQYVLGVDHTFGSVSVIAQYMGRYVFDWQKQAGPDPNSEYRDSGVLADLDGMSTQIRRGVTNAINSTLAQKNQILFGQTEKLQHMVSGRVEWQTLNETLSLSALGMVNFTTKEWAAGPKVLYKISDRLSTAVGAEIYRGPEGTLFGMIKDVLSAGFAELRYSF